MNIIAYQKDTSCSRWFYPSFNASTYAIDWAKRNDAELIAIHVIYPTYSPFQTALSPRSENSGNYKKRKGKRATVYRQSETAGNRKECEC